MNTFRSKQMLSIACQRLEDAEVLASSSICGSDSAYLLKLLAFELLLKRLYEITLNEKAPRRHEYHVIFQALPKALQKQILDKALYIDYSPKLASNHKEVLQELGKNFIDLRYPYDRYDDISEDEYASMGEVWIEQGCKEEDAMFRFHPTELNGLTQALLSFD